MIELIPPDDEEPLSWLYGQDRSPRLAPEGWPGRRFGLVCVIRRPGRSSGDPPELDPVVVTSSQQMMRLGEVDGLPKLWFRVRRSLLETAVEERLTFEDPEPAG